MRVRFLDLTPQSLLRKRLDEAYKRVMDSGNYILGSEVSFLSSKITEYYNNTVNCVCLNSGFDALQLLLRAANIGHGDSVVVPAFTPVPVWASVAITGAIPIGADVCASTYNMTIESIRDAIDRDTKAVIVVHTFGCPVENIDEIRSMLWGNDIIMIEDCSHAFGATFRNGHRVGTIGDVAAVSFYPTKNFGGYGDAGAILASDNQITMRCRTLQKYGNGTHRGINSRLDELQAAFLVERLKKVDEENKQRKTNAAFYLENLRNITDITLPQDHTGHVWHQFVIRHPKRNKLQIYLRNNEIETMRHYDCLPPQMDLYAIDESHFPISEVLAKEVLSLPIAPHLTREQLEYVVNTIKEF